VRVSAGLLERERVLAAIERRLDQAAGGRGGALLLVGEAGLGKTTMLEAAIEQGGRRFRVGVGRADALEARLPFGILAQALSRLLDDDVARELFELSDEDGVDTPAPRRFFALLRSIRAAAVRPLLLAFDDLHWADADSLAFLHLLCRRIGSLPFALIGTMRPWPDAALRSATDLAAQGLAELEQLERLSESAAEAVVRGHAGGGLSPRAMERILAACNGNPLLLAQLAETSARATGEEGIDRARGSRRLLLTRFLAADEAAQRYLSAASVLGTRFRPRLAGELAGLTPVESALALDALFRAGDLEDDGPGSARFKHDLIRQAVYEELAPPVRAQLHESASRLLAGEEASAPEIAEHIIAARLADPPSVAVLAQAGREALHAGAVRQARRYLQAGVSLAGVGTAPELVLDLARALVADGDSEAALDLLQTLLTRPSLAGPARFEAMRALGRAALEAGQMQLADRWFEAAVGRAEDEPDLAVAILLDRVFLAWARLGPGAALPLATRARTRSARAEPLLAASALAAWALCAYLTGDPDGLQAAEEAVGSAALDPSRPGPDGHWVLEPSAVPADVAVWAERFEDGEVRLRNTSRAAEQRAEPFLLFHACFSLSDLLCRLGRLDEALAQARRALEIAELVPIAVPLATAAEGLALLEAGKLEEAAARRDRLREMPGRDDWYLARGCALRLDGTLALRQGGTEPACATFRLLEEHCAQAGERDPCHIPWALDAITAYLLSDRPDDGRRIVQALEESRLPSRWPKAAAAFGRAALAERNGDRAATEESLAECLALLDELPLPLARAWALTEYGAFLNRSGETGRARPPLAQALALAEGCGAAWHAARARAEWRRAGGRTPRTPPGELTPQETSVARLARTGKTNKQIAEQLYLSVNTVETHLAHIYRKLGIRRRWELIAREDLEPPRPSNS
jgi:DNA-binding CsgD family transcriptional regulator